MPDGIKQLRGKTSLPSTSKNHLITKKISGISKFSIQLKCHLKQANLTLDTTSFRAFSGLFANFKAASVVAPDDIPTYMEKDRFSS